LYVVFLRGPEAVDNWLVALSGTSDPTINYPTDKVYRYYIGCKLNGANDPTCDGIQPGHFVEVAIPFYTQLKDPADGKTLNGYADWFNGNRILFYDDQAQILQRIKDDKANALSPVGQVPCFRSDSTNTADPCTNVTVFQAPTGFPAGDRAQLTEYT